MLRYYAYIMLCVGTFLMNSVPALVLFHSGASWSFVSLAFSQHISVSREALSRPLRVSIADERGDICHGGSPRVRSLDFRC